LLKKIYNDDVRWYVLCFGRTLLNLGRITSMNVSVKIKRTIEESDSEVTYTNQWFTRLSSYTTKIISQTAFASRIAQLHLLAEWRFAGTGRIILHYLLEADEQVRAAGAQRILRSMTPKSNSLNICADEEKMEEKKSATPTQT
jgi:hypothetical protein